MSDGSCGQTHASFKAIDGTQTQSANDGDLGTNRTDIILGLELTLPSRIPGIGQLDRLVILQRVWWTSNYQRYEIAVCRNLPRLAELFTQLVEIPTIGLVRVQPLDTTTVPSYLGHQCNKANLDLKMRP